MTNPYGRVEMLESGLIQSWQEEFARTDQEGHHREARGRENEHCKCGNTSSHEEAKRGKG